MELASELARVLLLPAFFLFFPFFYLSLKKMPFKKMLDYLHLGKKDYSTSQNLIYSLRDSLFILIVMIAITFVETSLLAYFGYMDLGKVEILVSKQAWYVFAIIILVSPIAEEIFFRGFLQKKFGLVASAIIFGASHGVYGSIAELIGALTMGLVLGAYVLKKQRLLPVIFAHMLYNSLSIYAILT